MANNQPIGGCKPNHLDGRAMNGELIPLKGGDPIPLTKDTVVVGRRKSCDVHLPYHNISSKHCELVFEDGTWIVTDLDSTNGVMVNGVRIAKKRLRPGDDLAFARKHFFRINYVIEGKQRFEDLEVPFDRVRAGRQRDLDLFMDDESRRAAHTHDAHAAFGNSLLERAGLEKQKKEKKKAPLTEDDIDTPLDPSQK
jgi:pSer/pThr/pTyr-binding forkhead associated (FHA) protein